MGENAIRISDGAIVKIGTCENMWYLRADQRELVRAAPRSLDVNNASILGELRFRFPFPDEDAVAPGDFKDYDKTFGVHVAVPDEVSHGQIQFVSESGYNVMLPCPESPEGASFETAMKHKFHRNRWSGATRIFQQRFVGKKLVTLAKCGGCGVVYRMNNIEDAQPIVDELRRIAEEYYDSRNYREVADRIVRGYVEGK